MIKTIRPYLISKEVIILHYRSFIKHSYKLTLHWLMDKISRERVDECWEGQKESKNKEMRNRRENVKVEKDFNCNRVDLLPSPSQKKKYK